MISIVMPIYNGEKLVEETIDSIIQQSYENWELIIVDDKSTDSTCSIINKYILKDRRIKLIQLDENCGGPAKPRNIGIENSKGEYIALIDADDIWHKDKLSECSKYLDNDIIYHWERCFNKDINDGKLCIIKDANMYDNLYIEMLVNGNIFSPSAIIIKKEILLNNNFNITQEYHGVEDFDLWLRLASQNIFSYKMIEKVLGYYRLHDGGISKNFKKHGQKERHLLKEHFKKFKLLDNPYMSYKKYKKLFRSILVNIFRTIQYKQKLDIGFYLKEFIKCF